MVQEKTDEKPPGEQEKQCSYCDFTYQNTKGGRARYMTHVKTDHPDQTVSARQRREEEERLADLSPLARRLHESLRRVVPRSTSVDTIVNVFNRNSSALGRDRHRFRSWIQRYGLTQDQISQVEDELFGVEGAQGPEFTAGQPGGQQLLGYVPAPGGGYQPIILFPQQAPQAYPSPQGSPQPIFVMPSTQTPQTGPPADTETKNLIGELHRKFADLLDLLKESGPSGRRYESPSQPMRRIPMLDEGGVIMRDNQNQIIYQEVPYDPTMGAVEMMRGVANIMKTQQPPPPPPAKEIDEEVLALKLKEKLASEFPKQRESGISPELQKALDEQKAITQQVGAKISQLERDGEIRTAVKEAVEPLYRQLEEAKSRSGMTDTQFTLAHREKMAGIWQGFLTSLVGGVREDMRPLIVQNAVAAMKQLGIPDEIVQAAVATFSAPTRMGGALQTKVEEARAKWIK